MSGLNIAAGLGELLDKEAVELVSGKAERRLGKRTAGKNRRTQREEDIGRFHCTQVIESGTKSEGFDDGECATAQVFATDPMARIAPCLVELDGDPFLTELKPEGKSGQSAAKNCNRFHGCFSALKKWVKGPMRCSVRDQSERLGHKPESS